MENRSDAQIQSHKITREIFSIILVFTIVNQISSKNKNEPKTKKNPIYYQFARLKDENHDSS